MKKYYHFEDDLIKYPDVWCYCVWSKRGPGKTYSSLKYAYENNITIIYLKRTIDDVNLICSANNYGFDPSPYKPINRDCGYNIKPKLIREGIGAFWNYVEGEPVGAPVAYILAVNAVKKFKGFDFSECSWIIFDEFVPQIIERTNRGEGESVLDLYMTVQRDREARGNGSLKLVLFANAENISTPVTNTLEIVDNIADLNNSGKTHFLDQERGILLHHITNEEIPITEEEKQGIFKAMKHSAWASKAFDGEFANNDFTNICKCNLKGYKPFIHLHYKTFDYYIYVHDNGNYYMSYKPIRCELNYDLNLENDQKLFYAEWAIDLRDICSEGRMKFEKYTMYDLIVNYKKFFKL